MRSPADIPGKIEAEVAVDAAAHVGDGGDQEPGEAGGEGEAGARRQQPGEAEERSLRQPGEEAQGRGARGHRSSRQGAGKRREADHARNPLPQVRRRPGRPT